MKIEFVYGICPVFLDYSDDMADWKGGYAKGPYVRIRKKYLENGDVGIVKHEFTHVKQWYRTLGIHSFLYLLSKDYRYKAEIEAYRAQLDCYGNRQDPPDWCVKALATKYNLNVSETQIINDLKE